MSAFITLYTQFIFFFITLNNIELLTDSPLYFSNAVPETISQRKKILRRDFEGNFDGRIV